MYKSRVRIPGSGITVEVELSDDARTAQAQISAPGRNLGAVSFVGDGWVNGRASLRGQLAGQTIPLTVNQGEDLTLGEIKIAVPEIGSIGVDLRFKKINDSAGPLDTDQDGDVDAQDAKLYAKRHPVVTGLAALGVGVGAWKIASAIWRAI